MPRFPTTEPEMIALCQQLIAGLNAGAFDEPLVKASDLQTQLDLFITKRNDATASEAAYRLDVVEKDAEKDVLEDMMKSSLRDCENKAKGDNAKLQQVGWGARAQAVSLQNPEQPRALEVVSQGDTSVSFDWKSPVGGGAVSFYKIYRRERPAGAWEEVGSAGDSEAVLINQPKGKELEYRTTAVNRSGESIPSNSVMVVL